jgi:hypothetical protein
LLDMFSSQALKSRGLSQNMGDHHPIIEPEGGIIERTSGGKLRKLMSCDI